MNANVLKNNIREVLLGRGHSAVEFVRTDRGPEWDMSPRPIINRKTEFKGPKGSIEVSYRNSDGLNQAAYFCEGLELRDQIERHFLDMGYKQVNFTATSKVLFFWGSVDSKLVEVQYHGVNGLQALSAKLEKEKFAETSLA